MLSTVSKHPCFNEEAKDVYARVHLPVAPKCNVQCNYCSRKFDCVNESRPGVTSRILTPKEAFIYFDKLKSDHANISVVGIAGPGDPLANAEETFETVRLISAKYPDIVYCLSTNGLNLPDNVDKIIELGISHVTVTMNSIDPEVAGSIYSWMRYKKKVYRNREAGELLIKNQLEGIKRLKEAGLVVKINTIILPGINDDYIEAVARTVKSLGADKMNCIPLIPTKDTAYEDLIEPTKGDVHKLRMNVGQIIDQMKHCGRCRADAAGLIGKDMDIDDLMKAAQEEAANDRPYVAVASMEGVLVNQHLGEMENIRIFGHSKKGFKVIEEREAPLAGMGDMRWKQLALMLKDCRAILVNGIGPKPLQVLTESGIKVIEMTGMIDEGLEHIYESKELYSVSKKDYFKCGDGCKGTGGGCA